jgi:hypothetical protein
MSDPWGFGDEPEQEEAPDSPRATLAMLDRQAELLVAVATGGPPIKSVNGEYKTRRAMLRPALRTYEIPDPFPWDDLWRWYGHWSQHLPTYVERRLHIAELVSPARERLEQLIEGRGVDDTGPADDSTWPGLERRLQDAKTRLDLASGLDDWQDVGRRCREILIDLASLVYRDEMLPAGEPQQPKGSDAKARLGYAAVALFGGSEHAELRTLIRAAWDLANKVTHSGSVGDQDAFASVQATVLLVRVFERARPRG